MRNSPETDTTTKDMRQIISRFTHGHTRAFLQFWLPVGLYMGVIIALSADSSPDQHFPDSFELINDKVAHAAEYGLLGFLLFRAFRFGTRTFLDRAAISLAIWGGVGFGVTDEVHQFFVPGREMDGSDLIADGLGATIGAFGGWALYRTIRLKANALKIGLAVLIWFWPLFPGKFMVQAETSQHLNEWNAINHAGMRAYQRNQLAAAKSLFLEALTVLPPTQEPDPRRAMTLNNLAAVHEKLGEYEEAELRYRNSLGIIEAIQGSDHPDVVLGLNNLASLYEHQRKWSLAEPVRRRALAILETTLGEGNPHVVPPLLHLTVVLEALGKFQEAEDLYIRALRITEHGLGPRHPQKARILLRYAHLLRLVDRDEEADILEKQAAAIQKANPQEFTP